MWCLFACRQHRRHAFPKPSQPGGVDRRLGGVGVSAVPAAEQPWVGSVWLPWTIQPVWGRAAGLACESKRGDMRQPANGGHSAKSASTLAFPRPRERRPPCLRRIRWAIVFRSTLGRVAGGVAFRGVGVAGAGSGSCRRRGQSGICTSSLPEMVASPAIASAHGSGGSGISSCRRSGAAPICPTRRRPSSLARRRSSRG
jgi:hypothetical protein